MLKKISWLFFFPLYLLSQELEVRLSTRNSLTPVYLTAIHVPTSEYDWRYFDELRGIFEFDLNTNGFSTVLPLNEEWEGRLKWPDVRNDFNLDQWKHDHIPGVLAVQVFQNRFQLIAFDIANGTSKKYPDFQMTGRIDEDRKQI